MRRRQIDDFNSPTKDDLFYLCMEELKGRAENNGEINIEAHRDLLVRYHLQKYNNLFIDYQSNWFYRRDIFDEHIRWHENNDKKELPYKIKVSKVLKLLLSRETVPNNSLVVSFYDLYNKIDISDSKLFNQLKDVFVKEFERLGLNETNYTREEALEEIMEASDPDWFLDYGPVDCFDGIYIYPNLITEQLIEDYMNVHYKQREITLGLVDEAVTELEMIQSEKKGKAGAKIKNMNIGELAKRLSYIHRIQDFLNQNEYSTIKDFPLTNDTCRFIYEYFEFWGLLYGHVKFDRSEKDKRAHYIRSLIRNNENLSKRGIYKIVRGVTIIDKDLELRIDLFKKVKNGLITQDEFYQQFPMNNNI